MLDNSDGNNALTETEKNILLLIYENRLHKIIRPTWFQGLILNPLTVFIKEGNKNRPRRGRGGGLNMNISGKEGGGRWGNVMQACRKSTDSLIGALRVPNAPTDSFSKYIEVLSVAGGRCE